MDWPTILILLILTPLALLLAGLIWEWRKSARKIREIMKVTTPLDPEGDKEQSNVSTMDPKPKP